MSADNPKGKSPHVPVYHVSIHPADKCPVRAAGGELVARAGDAANTDKGGPSKVVSDAYRVGWDTIFGTRAPAGKA